MFCTSTLLFLLQHFICLWLKIARMWYFGFGCWPSRCWGICWKFPFPAWLSSFKLYRLAPGDDLYACQSRNQRPATASTKMSLPGVISLDEWEKHRRWRRSDHPWIRDQLGFEMHHLKLGRLWDTKPHSLFMQARSECDRGSCAQCLKLFGSARSTPADVEADSTLWYNPVLENMSYLGWAFAARLKGWCKNRR